jgi:hypothetical protein
MADLIKVIALLNLIIIVFGAFFFYKTYPIKRIGKVHEYQFYNSEKACKDHDGLHYILDIEDIKNSKLDCDDAYYARCQDGKLIRIDYRMKAYCGISEFQLNETLEEIIIREKYTWGEK